MTNTLFLAPADFSRQLSLRENEAPVVDFDPHVSALWFKLLAETATPVGARLALAELGNGCFLPLMTARDQPGRLLAFSNFYSALFALPNEARAEPGVLQSLAEDMRRRQHGFHEARFAPMDTSGRSYALLRKAFANAGWLVDDYFCFGNWYYPVAGRTYDDYLAERPSRLRNTIHRAGGKLVKSGKFSLAIVQCGDSLESAITDFVAVYQRSWKNPEPYPEFIPGLCRLAAHMGWLRLGVVHYCGQPVAAQLWLVASGKAHIFKLAYDEAHAKLSAGTVLTAAMMRHVIDLDQVSEIDYLMGDDAYKREWMSLRRERRGLIAFNPRFIRGLGAMLWHRGGKILRRVRPGSRCKA